MTSTFLRTNLFQSLDQALQGQVLVIEYKGRKLELAAVEGGSKLSRAIRRDAIVGDPDDLLASSWDESQWTEGDRL